MKIDNSNERQKIHIRQAVFQYPVDKSLCVEFFCGSGKMTAFWSMVARRVIAIDKDKQKLESIDMPNVEKICGDNAGLIDVSTNAGIVDCDAYGLSLPIIKRVVEENGAARKIVFFTDGSPKWSAKARKKDTFEQDLLQLNPAAWRIEKNDSGTVYYGYAYFDWSGG